MTDSEYHRAAMKYAQNYQEQLLQMEDAMDKRLEAKIERIIDRKFHEFMERTDVENGQDSSQ